MWKIQKEKEEKKKSENYIEQIWKLNTNSEKQRKSNKNKKVWTAFPNKWKEAFSWVHNSRHPTRLSYNFVSLAKKEKVFEGSKEHDVSCFLI